MALLIFLATQRCVVPRYAFASAWDAKIPFVPASLLIYDLLFPYAVLASLLASATVYRQFIYALLLANFIALLCFYAWPEAIIRPALADVQNGFLRAHLARMWRLDHATHGFPSLHITLTVLTTWMLRDKPWRHWAALLAVLICLSTLTLKQHTLLDVLGGLVLAWVALMATQYLKAGIANHA